MKDASNILIKKYYERLNGAVSYTEGSETKYYKVFDGYSVNANATQPYITLSGYMDTELGQGSKSSYGLEAYLIIDIWVLFENSFGGTKLVNEIGNQVTELLRTRQAGYLDLSPDFQLISIVKDNSANYNELVTNGYMCRKSIRFKHLLEQLT